MLWLGQGISGLGSQMRLAAIGWQIYGLTHDPLQLGLIGLFRVGPLIACSLTSGSLADTTDRRKLFLWASLIEVVCSTGLAVVTLSGLVNVWWIYGITGLSSATSAFERPASAALLPSLVPPALLSNALSLNVLNWQTSIVIGPSLGGIVIAGAGVQGVYWLDALSYLAVVVAISQVRYRPGARPTTRISLRATVEGLRFVASNPIMTSIMLLDFLMALFGWGTSLLPVFAIEVLHTDEIGFGLLSAAQAVGAIIVSLIMAWLDPSRLRRPGLILLTAVFFFSLFTILFGLSTSLPFSLLCLALVGAGDTVSLVVRQTIFQLLTPDEMRGRLQSVQIVVFGGGPQLGEIEAGTVARWAGAPFSIVSGGVVCILVVIVAGLTSRRLRDYEFNPPK